MHDASPAAAHPVSHELQDSPSGTAREVVSTHVLVPKEHVERLKDLSRRSRVHQSDYLREAVNDLLDKYHPAGGDGL